MKTIQTPLKPANFLFTSNAREKLLRMLRKINFGRSFVFTFRTANQIRRRKKTNRIVLWQLQLCEIEYIEVSGLVFANMDDDVTKASFMDFFLSRIRFRTRASTWKCMCVWRCGQNNKISRPKNEFEHKLINSFEIDVCSVIFFLLLFGFVLCVAYFFNGKNDLYTTQFHAH